MLYSTNHSTSFCTKAHFRACLYCVVTSAFRDWINTGPAGTWWCDLQCWKMQHVCIFLHWMSLLVAALQHNKLCCCVEIYMQCPYVTLQIKFQDKSKQFGSWICTSLKFQPDLTLTVAHMIKCCDLPWGLGEPSLSQQKQRAHVLWACPKVGRRGSVAFRSFSSHNEDFSFQVLGGSGSAVP